MNLLSLRFFPLNNIFPFSKKALLVGLILNFSFITFSFSQTSKKVYPKNYFLFPINPGQTNYLAGNMGELRPNHFHGGLDIKTGGREGLPIYSSADGYVSRIKVNRGGYGNALYITHPNGYITVYGHVKSFSKPIEKYLREQQYALKSFEVDILPEKKLLPVKKGDIVALSGNTGGSGGPHLHFEIRDTLDTVLNPLYFGFQEIKDNVSPTITRLAIRAVNIGSRVNGEFGRQEFAVQKVNNALFTINKTISVWDKIGFELSAYDMANGVGNHNGVSVMEVKVDGKHVYSHHLETFTFDVSRHINVHVNYEVYQRTSNRFQRLYVEDGNELGIYQTGPDRGKITIRDEKEHQVSIKIWDAYQNDTELKFTIKGTPPKPILPLLRTSTTMPSIRYETHENLVKIEVKNTKDTAPATVFANFKPYEIPVAYIDTNEAVFMWDLRKGLLDSVTVGNNTETLNFKKTILSSVDAYYETDSLSIFFPKKALYDTLYLQIRRKDDMVSIGQPTIPLQESIDVRIKPTRVTDKARTAVYLARAGSLSYKGGTWIQDEISFKTKEFGSFTLATDTKPPVVLLQSKSPGRIVLKITDNLSGIDRFSATVNGEWLLMEYDYKTNLIWSERLDETKPLDGKFVLEVTDNAGNQTLYETNL